MPKESKKIDFFENEFVPFILPKEDDPDAGLYAAPEFDVGSIDFTAPEFESIGGKSRVVQVADQLKKEDGTDDLLMISPRKVVRDARRMVASNASSLCDAIAANGHGLTRCVVTGTFILGDMLDSILKKSGPSHVTIATFSFSRDNALMLCCNHADGFISSMDFITSDFFYGHYKETLWRMLTTNIRPSDRIRYAVCGTHAKMFLAIPDDKTKPAWSVEGSANLRSCQNVDHIAVDVDEQDKHSGISFHKTWTRRIIERFELKGRVKMRNNEMFEILTGGE